MDMTAEERGGLLLVRVNAERIDAASAIRFKDRMRELTAESESRVVLDMQAVDFIDSSGLGALVSAMKVLGPDRKLELAGLTAKVTKVLRLTRMDAVFRIHSDTAAAQAAGASAA
ncbi:MAG: anti-sigma factor antagonist [Deinococcus-Thermus bacterium]|jgi:anti-sigma B factor antagonist|nr:anti-sigma factor antagonist [Deinococcota bacterium]